MGINAGAVYSNAMCCAAPSKSPISKENGWNAIEKQEGNTDGANNLRRSVRRKIGDLLRSVGWPDCVPIAEYPALFRSLDSVIKEALYGCCYAIPRSPKGEGFRLFENEENVNLVKKNLPDFLKKLSTYLGSEDSKDKSELKAEMKASLNELPEQLSKSIVAALKRQGIML